MSPEQLSLRGTLYGMDLEPTVGKELVSSSLSEESDIDFTETADHYLQVYILIFDDEVCCALPT